LIRHIVPKSPLPPLFQIPRKAGLPFVKGGKEGFILRCLHHYGLIDIFIPEGRPHLDSRRMVIEIKTDLQSQVSLFYFFLREQLLGFTG
jgi:hypothetical protein